MSDSNSSLSGEQSLSGGHKAFPYEDESEEEQNHQYLVNLNFTFYIIVLLLFEESGLGSKFIITLTKIYNSIQKIYTTKCQKNVNL